MKDNIKILDTIDVGGIQTLLIVEPYNEKIQTSKVKIDNQIYDVYFPEDTECFSKSVNKNIAVRKKINIKNKNLCFV